jgi:hypothetical protein
MESEEVDLLRKCTVTYATNDFSQNSFEEPMSKPVQITGSPETYSRQQMD